jgi:hypothetical protein
VAVSKAKKAPKAHDRVGDSAGNIFDQQVIDLADSFFANAVNVSALHVPRLKSISDLGGLLLGP